MTTNETKYFTILGERCSGTNFLRYAIEWNFKLDFYSICGKHFFGHDQNVEFENERMDQTLVICLVRDPIDWIDSFFKRLHHVPTQNKKSIYNFLNNEFYSIYEVGEDKGKERLDDRNLRTGERYKNIFELRKTKNDFMLNDVPRLAKHSIILRYEDLRDNYDATLDRIREHCCLEPINETYRRIEKYKGTYIAEYYKKPILLSEQTQRYIMEKVDQDQEQALLDRAI